MAQPKKRPFVSLKGMETGRITSAGKPVYRYKGEEISEKSIDIEADGKTYVIPTVIDGKLYTEEAAVAKFFNKEVEPIKVLKENIKERSKKLAEGGTAMKKQMELFEDGGLKDEGGMTDEVSGNDVPSGSTREEVRDDIPAQLSEGEFVFPADVVRYIGLEKLMMLRQEAKQGLKQMEAMGQMGNSDEATMPDDLPFDETDLDIEDDLEYNTGGVVQAQQGTYVAPTVPTGSQPLGTNLMGNPMGVSQQVAGGVSGSTQGTPYVPNVGKMYGAGTTPYAPVSYQNFLGTSAGGAPTTENVRYFNEATGQTRMIPHLVNADGTRGATLYPVPEGFVIQEEAPKEEAKKTTATPTAKVKPVESGDDGGGEDGSKTAAVDLTGNPLSYTSIFGGDALDKTMKEYSSLQKSLFSPYDAGSRALSGKINANNVILAAGKIELSNIRGTISSQFNIPTNFDLGKLDAYKTSTGNYLSKTNIEDIRSDTSKRLNQNIQDIRAAIIDPTTGEVYTNKAFSKALKDYKIQETKLNKNTNIRSKRNIGEIVRELSNKKKEEIRKDVIEQRITDERSADVTGSQEDIAAQQSYEQELSDSGADYSGYDTGNEGVPDAYDDPMMNKGGLAGKKKTSKPKKMKRGGLASR